ncbi:MAG TPA: nucleotide disphospho-sugar-binding domain-containing protein [Chloroflexota bacterium]|nr:nucleotide disphospho-sugar-binding domain-containing protein [Chloroflexota bacterium]
MKILFATVPQAGHFNPPLPLAHAFAANGHQVAYATSPDFAKRANREGFEPLAVGPEFDAWHGELARRVGGTPGEGLAPEEIMGWFGPRLFAQVGVDLTLPDLIDAVASWRPDLVVYDTYNFAAPIAAALAGIPSVSHAVSPLPPISVFERCGEAVAPAWERHGLNAPPFGGIFDTACLSISPPSLNGPLPAGLKAWTWPLRPVGYDRGAGGVEAPGWLDILPNRPTIYATLGTHPNTDRAVFRAILDGLAGEDVNLIVTAGAVRDAVRAVLDDPTYRDAAGQLAAEIAAMPGPDEVTRQLEKLVSR